MPFDEERKLDQLFAAYREAIPDPEASPDFMPELWQKIEARQSPAVYWRRWANVFVTGALAASVLLSFALFSLNSGPGVGYVDSLAEADATEIAFVQVNQEGPVK
ncbi:MAG TPA: hypothetical protein DEH78_32490 [Solibacterales bacterium]|nr:hypothetical protein [Bryobacterales bacterium]